MSAGPAAIDAFRQSLRIFLAKMIAPRIDEWERDRGWPAALLFPEFGSRGLLGLAAEQAYGGLGHGYQHVRVLGEELGALDCAGIGMSVATHTEMAIPLLTRYGTDVARSQFAAPAIAGELVGSTALSEPGAGSDLGALSTTLVRSSTHADYVLNGRKSYATNGSVADFHIVLCRSQQDAPVTEALTLVVVPASSTGVTAVPYRDKLGYWSCDHAEIEFDQVRLPGDYVIGDVGAGYPIQAEQLTRERLMAAVLAHAQAGRLLALAAERARTRRTFGARLIDSETISARLAELDASITLVGACLDKCELAMLGDGRNLSKLVLVAKLAGARAWQEAADCALQIFAGHGYLAEPSVQRGYRDARAAQIAGGTSEMLLRNLAGYLP